MSGPVRVHLLRHGAPDQPGRLLGRTDAGVTAAGIAACRMAALEVGDVALHSSDLVRALDCARAIGGARPVAIDPRWRELDFGAWDGRLPGACDREALDRFHTDPDACPPPGGERWSALCERVGAALADLTRAGDAALVVTHGGTMRAALAVGCGLDAHQVWAFDLPYAARLSLDLWPGMARDAPPMARIVGLAA